MNQNINVNGKSQAEEEQYLSETQGLIQQQIDEKNLTLSAMKQDIVEHRKYVNEEIPRAKHALFMQDDPVKEKQYISLYERIGQLERMYYAPYFGSIIYEAAEDGTLHEYYIGKNGFSVDAEPRILDWRTPVASLFYQQRLGKMSYRAPSGVSQADLKRRRQYIVKKGELKGLFDSEIDIKDDVLQMVLSGNSGSRLKEVISTIQKEQDDVIRLEPEYNIILNGVAGSGKTTIVLHRIAYLLYNYRERMSNNVLILGPNRLFMDYISDVLPDLGESENTFQDTVKGLATRILRPTRSVMRTRDYYERILAGQDKAFAAEVRHKSSLSFKSELDKAFKSFEEEQKAVKDLVYQNQVIMSADERNQLFYKTNARLPYLRRADRVTRLARNKLKELRNQTVRRIQNAYRYKMKQAKEQKDFFLANELVLEENEAIRAYLRDVYRFSKTLRTLYAVPDLEKWYGETVGKTENDFWVEDDLIGLLYIKTKLEGKGCYPVRHLVIDEAQDISAFGFHVLKQMTGAESYTVVGDVRQKIRGGDYHSMMDEWEQVLSQAEKEQVRQFELKLSYRSTREIIDYSKSMLKRDSDVTAVDRSGAPVEHLTFDSPLELPGLIVSAVGSLKQSPEIEHAAILCRTIAEAQALYSMVKDKLDVTLVSREEEGTAADLVIMPVYFAKGLEFDGVVAVEAAPTDDDGELSYILCTRALHRLVHITAK